MLISTKTNITVNIKLLLIFFTSETRNSHHLHLHLSLTHHSYIATNKAKTNRNSRIIQSFLSTSSSLSFPEWCLALEMFPLKSWVSVRAYGGIRAQMTDSVAHLLTESTVFKTKVACGHDQWYDNSMKRETHFRRQTLSSPRRGFYV